jgi:hypothetical protein
MLSIRAPIPMCASKFLLLLMELAEERCHEPAATHVQQFPLVFDDLEQVSRYADRKSLGVLALRSL